jgi:putative addiction module component (TIGR02574 family)
MLSREEVLSHALSLSPGDREVVAVALQDSLEGPSEAETFGGSEFYEELRRRSKAYRTGKSRAQPAAEVMAELYQKQVDETAP